LTGAGTLVLASSNPGKLAEIQAILAGTGVEVRPQGDFDVSDAAETGLTFIENAIIKARNAAAATGHAALADDSGLCVDALDGAPGVYSARYAGEGAGDEANTAKLLAALDNVPDAARAARFQCVIALLRHANDPTPVVCTGTWEGAIQREATGSNGFGYDPVFHVKAHHCSAAELDSGTKNRISHRGRALAALKEHLASPGIFG
jgi:XTP/dITP diphosphohydrolase